MAKIGTPFFGIGAMRSGTGWLSKLLSERPDCWVAPLKELHFFDVRYGLSPGSYYYRRYTNELEIRTSSMIKRLRENLAPSDRDDAGGSDPEIGNDEGPEGAWTDEIRQKFFRRAQVDRAAPRIREILDYFSIRDIKSYAEYLRRNGKRAAAFGEITPAYALLPADGFAEMEGLFPGKAKFIFIMRDPVDRLWSHVRLSFARAPVSLARGTDQEKHPPSAEELNGRFMEKLKQRSGAMRSNYKRTIEELEKSVPRERVLYLFYERLTSNEFGAEEICRIEDMLGLQRGNPTDALANAVNATAPATIPAEIEAAALAVFRPVYEYIEQRFGQPYGWRQVTPNKATSARQVPSLTA